MTAPLKKVEADTRETMQIVSPVAAKKKITAKKIKQVERPPDAMPTPAVEMAQSLVLEQPGLLEPPPAPPDSDDLPRPAQLTDRPGGPVLVLALQLNSDNEVVLTDILVPSSEPFSDLAYSLSMRGRKWSNVEPPIPPGQYRWLELRIDYRAQKDNDSVLP